MKALTALIRMCFVAPVAFLFSGCATSHRPQSATTAEQFLIQDPVVLQDAIGRQLERKEGEPHNILVLSGGAAHGAFGAGLLNGWNSTHNMPKWDIVTGISTGALLATCAFLAGEDDFEILHTNYTKVQTSDIIRPKWLGIRPLAALFSTSLYSSEPLRRRIRQQITDAKIRQVAQAGSEHRRLFIGTVDLYSGSFFIWDMTKLARVAVESNSPALFDQYREILRASAAIPGYFPPVVISRKSHVDGGTREQLFFRDRFIKAVAESKQGYRRAADQRSGAAAPGPSAAPAETEARAAALPTEKLQRIADSKTHLYVIVNGGLQVDGTFSGGSALAIGFRSISILTDAALVSDLFATESMAAAIPNIEFHFAAEGKGAPPLTPGEFDGKEMTPLYEYGYAIGQQGQWQTHVQFEDVNAAKIR